MKKYRLLFAVGFIAALVGCQSGNLTNNLNLVVVKQTDTIQRHEENYYCWASFYVDAPVNGPQMLVDSVMVLINKEVYRMCEYCIEFVNSPDENVAYGEKDMFTNDGEHLLNHYLEKYKPLIEDSLWNTFGLELKMEAQTEKFVTYGVERFHCGGSCGSEKYFYTFDKRDGHLVKEIISYENLVSFFKDYPEYSSIDDDPWFGRVGWQFYQKMISGYDYGLLEDHFSFAIQGYGNHYLLLRIPYSQIFSYLSPEAQALVERHEEDEPMLPAYLPHTNSGW